MKIENFTPLPPDIRGWNSNKPIFKDLIDRVNPTTIIEVGCWKGASTIEMAKHTKATIFCVDTWLGALEFYTEPTNDRDLMKFHGYPQVYYQFLSNIIHAGIVDQVEVFPVTSDIGAYLCPFADLIYIDGSHQYEDVKKDTANYWPLLRHGGIMFGDDYGNGAFPGVKKAVDESGLKIHVVDNWFWYAEKDVSIM